MSHIMKAIINQFKNNDLDQIASKSETETNQTDETSETSETNETDEINETNETCKTCKTCKNYENSNIFVMRYNENRINSNMLPNYIEFFWRPNYSSINNFNGYSIHVFPKNFNSINVMEQILSILHNDKINGGGTFRNQFVKFHCLHGCISAAYLDNCDCFTFGNPIGELIRFSTEKENNQKIYDYINVNKEFTLMYE